MNQREILNEIGKLAIPERLAVLETALHFIHSDLEKYEQPLREETNQQRLSSGTEFRGRNIQLLTSSFS